MILINPQWAKKKKGSEAALRGRCRILSVYDDLNTAYYFDDDNIVIESFATVDEIRDYLGDLVKWGVIDQQGRRVKKRSSLAADYVAETLAAILDAIDDDCIDDKHKNGGWSIVLANCMTNAKNYFTRPFCDLLDDARRALNEYHDATEGKI